jgi:hypothetical protein
MKIVELSGERAPANFFNPRDLQLPQSKIGNQKSKIENPAAPPPAPPDSSMM